MLLNGDMHKMRVIENIFELHRAFTASTCFDFCSFCSLFFCRARRLTLIRIRILIHIQFFIVVAFVAFCFATRYVSCFANQHPPSSMPRFPACSFVSFLHLQFNENERKRQIATEPAQFVIIEKMKKGREREKERAKGVGFRLSITCNLNKLSVLWAFQFDALPHLPPPTPVLRSTPLKPPTSPIPAPAPGHRAY